VEKCVESRKRQLDCLERMWVETPVARETKMELNLSSHDELSKARIAVMA
jgi:hypothetical protein